MANMIVLLALKYLGKSNIEEQVKIYLKVLLALKYLGKSNLWGMIAKVLVVLLVLKYLDKSNGQIFSQHCIGTKIFR